MKRINVRQANEWIAFDKLIVSLLIILFLLLLAIWFFNTDHLPFNCCVCDEQAQQEQKPAAEPIAIKAPPITPTPIEPPLPSVPPTIALSLADNRAVIRGRIQTEASKQALMAQLKAQLPNSVIIDKLTVDADVMPLTNANTFGAAIENLSVDDRLSFNWTPQAIRLTGVTDSAERKALLVNAIKDSAFTNALYDEQPTIIDQIEIAEKGPSCIDILQAANIEFDVGSAVLTSNGRVELNKLMPCLLANAYIIIGHTDSSGDSELNKQLSLARAKSALEYLINKGMPANKFTTLGMGDQKPIADNTSKEGKAKNRRIEFRAK